MKNIAIITNGTLPVPPIEGGAVENLLYEFIKGNESTKDFNLTIYTVWNNDSTVELERFKYSNFVTIKTNSFKYRLSQGFRFLVNSILLNKIGNAFISRIIKKLKKNHLFDGILIENNPFFPVFLRQITDKPIILHLHNDYLNKNNLSSGYIVRNIDFIISVSDYIQSRVLSVLNNNNMVTTVYNGIDIARFSKGDTLKKNLKLKESLGISIEDTVIIYSGRIQEHKGIKILIKSFIEISKYTTSVKLLLIGGSEFSNSKKTKFIEELESLIHPIQSRVIFTGYIDYNIIHKYYAIGDFAVIPSLCEEAFGLTVVESMAAGLPVIISDAGGLPEVVTDNCSFIVKRDQYMKINLVLRMRMLIDDNVLRLKMSKAAKLRASFFTKEKYCESLSRRLKIELQ